MAVVGRRILVLGANGVLGSAIAAHLAASGAVVLGTARSDATSNRLSADLDQRLLVDVENPDSLRALAAYLASSGEGLDGVVNAIGLVAFATVADTPPSVADRLMRVNHLGPAALITDLLPLLRSSSEASRAPFIASITGIVAERAFPGMSAYIASKSAHSAWLHALRLELRRPAVRVIEARPGHCETGLAGRAILGTAPAFPVGMDPEHVASVIVGAIEGDATELASTAF